MWDFFLTPRVPRTGIHGSDTEEGPAQVSTGIGGQDILIVHKRGGSKSP